MFHNNQETWSQEPVFLLRPGSRAPPTLVLPVALCPSATLALHRAPSSTQVWIRLTLPGTYSKQSSPPQLCPSLLTPVCVLTFNLWFYTYCFLFLLHYFFKKKCVSLHVSLWVCARQCSACRDQRGRWIAWSCNYWQVLSHLVWMLGIGPRCF